MVLTNFACAFSFVFARNVDSKITLDLCFADFALYLSCFFIFPDGKVPCVVVTLGLSLSLEHWLLRHITDSEVALPPVWSARSPQAQLTCWSEPEAHPSSPDLHQGLSQSPSYPDRWHYQPQAECCYYCFSGKFPIAYFWLKGEISDQAFNYFGVVFNG